MEISDKIYYFYVGFFVMAILASFISLTLDDGCDCKEAVCEDKGMNDYDVDYVVKVDKVCYGTHNPYNGVENYRESWGSAYRICLLNNLNVDDRSVVENRPPVFVWPER